MRAVPSGCVIDRRSAEHYGVDPGQHAPHTTTLDYVVAAAAG